MKKMIRLFAVLLFVSGCATTTKQPAADPYSHVTVKNVQSDCKAAESWQVGVLGLSGYVFKFKDCVSVPTLLVISVDGTHTASIQEKSIELLAMHYMEFLKRQQEGIQTKKKIEPDKTFSIEKIKEEVHNGWLTHFFKLNINHGDTGCVGPTCKRKKH